MKIEPITSSHNSRYRQALKLHSSRGRQTQNRILIIGQREVSRALDAGLVFEEVMFEQGSDGPEHESESILRRLQASNTRCSTLSQSLFEKLAYGDRDAKVIGIAARPKTELGLLSIKPSRGLSSFVVVLEQLEKPGNLGAIARTADAAGVSAILVADPRTDIFHPNAIRASVATVFSVPVACSTAIEIKAWLETHEYQTYYATPEAKASLYQVDLTGCVAVVIGNEARGISPIWRAGTGIHLPMIGIGDSLNAAVTTSVLIYEAFRQRGSGDGHRENSTPLE
jgi:TrmH family RNA methyltransferase